MFNVSITVVICRGTKRYNCVLIIAMERHLTLTLTSDHINNTRNKFLRSDFYENMVLRMNLALLFKKVMICLLLGWPCWILANYKSSPKCPAGQPCKSACWINSLWSISNYVLCITIENRIFTELINIKVIFDLDFDLGSHK